MNHEHFDGCKATNQESSGSVLDKVNLAFLKSILEIDVLHPVGCKFWETAFLKRLLAVLLISPYLSCS